MILFHLTKKNLFGFSIHPRKRSRCPVKNRPCLQKRKKGQCSNHHGLQGQAVSFRGVPFPPSFGESDLPPPAFQRIFVGGKKHRREYRVKNLRILTISQLHSWAAWQKFQGIGLFKFQVLSKNAFHIPDEFQLTSGTTEKIA